MTETRHPELVEAALSYVERGWRVLPLHTPTPGIVMHDGIERPCSCNRPQCDSVGKHPRTLKGVKDATRDVGQIRSWWEIWPAANIGIAAGLGMVVIDVDGAEGLNSLFELERLYGPLPTGLRVRTGSGGLHIYLATTEHFANSMSAVGPGIDIRSEGAYVVAPPSLHASGERYSWVNP